MRALVIAALVVGLASAVLGGDKVRLNEATKEQLLALGLSQSQVVQIINYRQQNGNFLQVEELLAVPQMSRATFNTVRDKLTVDE
jgi:competence ComEA-like helix-hairpin-helix protein